LHFSGIIQHRRGDPLASTRLSYNISAHHRGETGWPVITHRERNTVSPSALVFQSSPGRLCAGHDGLNFPMRSVEADWSGSKNEEGQIARLKSGRNPHSLTERRREADNLRTTPSEVQQLRAPLITKFQERHVCCGRLVVYRSSGLVSTSKVSSAELIRP
jgi:hypothetical protein